MAWARAPAGYAHRRDCDQRQTRRARRCAAAFATTAVGAVAAVGAVYASGGRRRPSDGWQLPAASALRSRQRSRQRGTVARPPTAVRAPLVWPVPGGANVHGVVARRPGTPATGDSFSPRAAQPRSPLSATAVGPANLPAVRSAGAVGDRRF